METLNIFKRVGRKILLYSIFLAAFSYQAFGGELKVAQMGTGWLVSDELTDIIYNPARINNLGQDVLNIKLGRGEDPNGKNVEYDYANVAPEISYLKRFEFLNAGVYLNIIKSAMVVAGVKTGDNLSLGINVNILSYSTSSSSYSKYADKGVAAGAEYKVENCSYGVKLEYRSAYESMERYIAAATLLFEMKIGGAGRLRALNTFSYSVRAFEVDTASIPDFLNYGYFGRILGVNKTGISYSDNFGEVNYCLSMLNEWNFNDYYCQAYGETFEGDDYYNRYETGKDSETLVITLGCETSVFVDWIKFRLGYELIRAEYRYLRTRTFNDSEGETYTYDGSYMVKIIPSENSTVLRLGLGFKIGKDMDIDLKFGPESVTVLDNTDSNNRDGNWSDFNAEFIARF